MKKHSYILSCVAILVWLQCVTVVFAAPLTPVNYHEDFEGEDPVLYWTANGKHTVNFKGITDEKAFSGHKSFKLDVTLESGSYHYWSIPVRIPCASRLEFSARILVEQTTRSRVGLGPNYIFPPSRHSGCGPVGRISSPSSEWRLQKAELAQRGRENADSSLKKLVSGASSRDVAVSLSRLGIFIYGGKGGRVVIYVDDVKITGEAPSREDYDAEGKRRWQLFQQSFRKNVAIWRSQLISSQTDIEALGKVSSSVQKLRKMALQTIKSQMVKLDQLDKNGYASPDEVEDVKATAGHMEGVVSNIRELHTSGKTDPPYITFVGKAITNVKILPMRFPIIGSVSSELSITACRGEYEPASLTIFALRDIKYLSVAVGELKSKNANIPASAVDIRVVKCWYQAGVQIRETKHRHLTPELLLKDDGLIHVDFANKSNYLRQVDSTGKENLLLISGPDSENMKHIQPRDAATLQPVDMKSYTAKQFWITVHVPEDAAPGLYDGSIQLSARGLSPSELSLRVNVLPFPLSQSQLRYSIYYRGKLARDESVVMSTERKSTQQYELEMRNLKAHGVLYPTIYQRYDDTLLPRALAIRAAAGLPDGTLYTLGISAGNTTNPKRLKALRERVRKWRAIASDYGYDDLYIYGIDEARGDRLKSQRLAWRTTHEAGAKVFVACYKETFASMGDLLDLAVYSGAPNPVEAEKFHNAGQQIFCYNNPQVGVEQPETYRRNFGLLLWKKGYDGAMNYAYQHSENHGWNDFDSKPYRDHNFIYQTTDGLIDTMAWEGFREGVDDVRYLTTLLETIGRARNRKPELARQAELWVGEIDPSGDLDAIRQGIIGWIMRLM
jgi:hypothetical protein